MKSPKVKKAKEWKLDELRYVSSKADLEKQIGPITGETVCNGKSYYFTRDGVYRSMVKIPE